VSKCFNECLLHVIKYQLCLLLEFILSDQSCYTLLEGLDGFYRSSFIGEQHEFQSRCHVA
jgi:hypothetical protein